MRICSCIPSTVLLLFLAGCQQWPPERPENVPKSAVFVQSVKRGYWHSCGIDQTENICYCTIYLDDGRVVFNDIFLPYDGGGPVAENDLKITPNGTSDTIRLENGRLLLPKTRFKIVKRYWDDMLGKTKIN